MSIRDGVVIKIDGQPYRTKPASLKQRNDQILEVTITEGKNRQIRKMFQALGYEVIELHRLQIGQIPLGGLKEGESRELTETELQALFAIVPERQSRSGRKSPFEKRK